MNKKIIGIFFAWTVVAIPQPAEADELGKILGTTIGTIISVVSFSPIDRMVALTALTQLGGYFGGKVDIVSSTQKQDTPPPSSKEKVMGSLASDDARDVPWYTLNIAKEDIPALVSEKK